MATERRNDRDDIDRGYLEAYTTLVDAYVDAHQEEFHNAHALTSEERMEAAADRRFTERLQKDPHQDQSELHREVWAEIREERHAEWRESVYFALYHLGTAMREIILRLWPSLWERVVREGPDVSEL